MSLDESELIEELEHQRQMVKALRRRRRLLEHNHVTKGIETDPHILMQIEDISQQIKEREAEIARLQTISVQAEESLAEVEYRVAVAETLDTPQGIASYAGSARLELLRLRLGMPIEEAQSIESVVRAALAVRELGALIHAELNIIGEIANNENLNTTISNDDKYAKLQWNKCISVIKKLERAIYLDRESAIGWCSQIRKPNPEDLRKVLTIGNDRFGHFTQRTLHNFINRLERARSDAEHES